MNLNISKKQTVASTIISRLQKDWKTSSSTQQKMESEGPSIRHSEKLEKVEVDSI